MQIVIGPHLWKRMRFHLVCFLSNPLALPEGNKRNGNLPTGPGEEETGKVSKSLGYLSEQEVLR